MNCGFKAVTVNALAGKEDEIFSLLKQVFFIYYSSVPYYELEPGKVMVSHFFQ